jgi:hypothetical protein
VPNPSFNSYTPTAPVPRYASVPRWCALSGVARTRTYELIGEGLLKAIKVGSRTLIDVEAGLAWMATLPTVRIASAHKPNSPEAS